jgi:hypothetical protein
MATDAENPGGSGGECEAPPLTARDTRLIERAVRQRWDIPPALRETIPKALGQVASNPKASHRNRIAAARALIAADALNLGQEKHDDPKPARVSVLVLARELTDEQLARIAWGGGGETACAPGRTPAP